MSGLVALHRPRRVVSLLDPEGAFPELGPEYVGRHLRLGFHDICVPAEHLVMPSAEHIAALLGFLDAWQRDDALLIHCRAGISRSTAAAFVAACYANPDTPEHEIAVALRRAGPLARPNETLVKLADAALERSGRMSKAIAATGRDLPGIDVEEAEPWELSLQRPTA